MFYKRISPDKTTERIDVGKVLRGCTLKGRGELEIYAGDIIAVNEEYGGGSFLPSVVVFCEERFKILNINYFMKRSDLSEIDFRYIHKVVGNIFENDNIIREALVETNLGAEEEVINHQLEALKEFILNEGRQ